MNIKSKHITKKRIILAVCVVLIIALTWIVVANFVLAADLGQFTDSIFEGVDLPTNDRYANGFSINEICWELAYWSAMMAEFTYAKSLYPDYNYAMDILGFNSVRVHTYFEHDSEYYSDLMADIGKKDVHTDSGSFTLVAIAFRGTVPSAIDSRATRTNMRRNIDIFSQQWGETNGRVHRGFYAQYKEISDYIFPVINDALSLFYENNIKFWFTGHSMGGVFAELLTADLIERGVCPQRILTFSFASPLVGCRQMLEYSQEIGAATRIFRIIHRRDMIAYFGFGLMWGRSLACCDNIITFGNRGLINRSSHGLPLVYLPFIIEQNSPELREQMKNAYYVARLR